MIQTFSKVCERANFATADRFFMQCSLTLRKIRLFELIQVRQDEQITVSGNKLTHLLVNC